MSSVELKHTIAVDESAWFIRFYLWLWQGDAERTTFCKLFWGYVFAVPAHAEGFRAEHAKIIALVQPATAPERALQLLRDIAQTDHHAPLVPRNRLNEVAREHGDPVPTVARYGSIYE